MAGINEQYGGRNNEQYADVGNFIVAASDTPTKLRNKADLVCDGVQDNEQIQDALDASNDGHVALLGGEYSIYDTFTVPTGMTLAGVGPSTKLKLANGRNRATMKNADWSGGNSDIVIRDMKIDGNLTNNPSTLADVGMLHFKNADRLHLIGLVCTESSRVGVEIEDSEAVRIIGNDLGTADRDCVAFNAACLDCLVQGNIIHGAQNSNAGVEVQGGCKRVTIQGNTIFDNETNVSISSHAGEDACEGVVISGNAMKDAVVGIHISGTTPTPDVTQLDILITGNLISDTTGTTGNRYALLSDNTKGLVFVGNQVVTARYALKFAISTLDTIISGNHFIARVVDDERKFIQLLNTVNRMLISDNSIIDYEYRCFVFDSTLTPTDIRIKNNQIINVKRGAAGQAFDFGMTGDVSTRCVIEGNYIDASKYADDIANGAAESLPAGWIDSEACEDVFPNLQTADDDKIVVAIEPANGAQSIADQPNCARAIAAVLTDGDSSVSAMVLTIIGTDSTGKRRTEVLTFGGTGTETLTTAYGYTHIDSATISALAGTTAGDTIKVGTVDKLGLQKPLAFTGDVFQYLEDGADTAVPTVTTAGLVTLTTAANGYHDYVIRYRSNLNSIGL